MSFSGFGVRQCIRKCYYLLFFGRVCVELVLFLPLLCNRISMAQSFLCWKVFNYKFNFFISREIDTKIIYYVLSKFWYLYLLSIYPFHPNCQIYYDKTVHNILFIQSFFYSLAQNSSIRYHNQLCKVTHFSTHFNSFL